MNYRTMAREDFWDYAQQARSGGKDLAEVLDREGVLLTPQRKAEIQHETLEQVLTAIHNSDAHQWVERGCPVTPKDVKDGIVRYLAEISGEALVKANRGY